MLSAKDQLHSPEEYDRIMLTIKDQLSRAPEASARTFHDEFSTQLVQDRISKLELDKQVALAQIEIFQRLIAELHPELDEIITELARLQLLRS